LAGHVFRRVCLRVGRILQQGASISVQRRQRLMRRQPNRRCASSLHFTLSIETRTCTLTLSICITLLLFFHDLHIHAAGCIDQPKIGSVSLDVWRGKYICFKREGEAQMLSKTALRPVPSAAGTCPNGYQACGDGTMESDRTTCQPTTSSCPATGATADTSTPSGYAAASAIATSDTTSWFTRVSYAGEMPINEVTLALWDPDGKRGDCYGSGADQSSYVGSGRSYDYANDYPSECTRRDIRWEVLDLNAESEVLSANFDLQPSCTDTTDKLDYISTGTKCGTTPTSDPDCSVYVP